jgi:hypothetical protein
MININLKKFDPKCMENRRVDPNQGPPSILLIGSKRTGKTYLIADLMYYFRKIPAGMIFTGSEASSEKFSEFFPKSFIFDKVDDASVERMEKVVATQRKLRKKKTQGDYSSLLLFDDCGYDKKIVNKEIIKGIFMNGRNWKILLMMAVQYCKSVPPDLRANTDYVFILREPFIENRKKIWREYAGIIPKFEVFCQIMDICTENYGCLVIDKTTTSNKIEDNVFWYRAKNPSKSFKVGGNQLWDYYKKNYKSDEGSDEESSSKKLNESKVVIKKLSKKKKKKLL